MTHSYFSPNSLIGDMTHWQMWLTYVTWLTHICDITRSYVTCIKYRSTTCLLGFVCDMTHSNMWHDSFILVTWLTYVRHDPLRYVKRLTHIWDKTHSCVTCPKCRSTTCKLFFHTCDMAHSYIWHDSFVQYTTHSYIWRDSVICDMTHSCSTWLIQTWHSISIYYMWHDSFVFVTWLIRTIQDQFTYVTWLIQTRHSISIHYMWHDSFIYVTWLICICDMTHSYHTGPIHICVMTHSHVTRPKCPSTTCPCS